MLLPAEMARLANVSESDLRRWMEDGLPSDSGVVHLRSWDLRSLLEFIREAAPHPSLRTVPRDLLRIARDNPLAVADPR